MAGLAPTLSLLVFHAYIGILGISTYEYLTRANDKHDLVELAKLEKDPKHQQKMEARRLEQETIREQYLKDQAKRKEMENKRKKKFEHGSQQTTKVGKIKVLGQSQQEAIEMEEGHGDTEDTTIANSGDSPSPGRKRESSVRKSVRHRPDFDEDYEGDEEFETQKQHEDEKEEEEEEEEEDEAVGEEQEDPGEVLASLVVDLEVLDPAAAAV